MSDVFTALGDEHRQSMLLLFEKGERLNVGRIVEVSRAMPASVTQESVGPGRPSPLIAR